MHCIPDLSLLWRSTREVFTVYTSDIQFHSDSIKQNFFPFSNESDFILTYPVAGNVYIMRISENYMQAHILRIIAHENICHPTDCVFANKRYYITDQSMIHELQLLVVDGCILLESSNPDNIWSNFHLELQLCRHKAMMIIKNFGFRLTKPFCF